MCSSFKKDGKSRLFFSKFKSKKEGKNIYLSIQVHNRAPKAIWPRKHETYSTPIGTTIRLNNDEHGEKADEKNIDVW